MGFIDTFEYATDAAAQAAYPTNGFGSELVVNGTMEADSGWSNVNTPATNERSTTQVHGGTYSRKLVSDSTNDGIGSAANIDIVNGYYYRLTAWIYPSQASFRVGLSGYTQLFESLSINTWQQVTVNFVATSTASLQLLFLVPNETASTIYIDDVSMTGTPLQSYSESTIKSQGSYSLKAVATTGALNKTLTHTF